MKFGISFANTMIGADPASAVALATTAEEAGFESLWTVEHVVVPAGYESRYPYSRSGRMAGGAEDFDLPDPLVWLSFLAGVTSSIRLATGILILPQRNPVVLAKEVATLDALSGGRVILGVGSGWLAEEVAAIGSDFADRGDRTDEYIGALRTLWSHDLASFDGPTVSFDDVYLRPRPHDGPVPIVIGGHSPRAARRAGELGDGFFPAAPHDALPAIIATAREHAERSGRDPAGLEITAGGNATLDDVERLAELGVDRMLIPVAVGLDGLGAFGEVIAAHS